jgi:glycosyltransferase involved in cell wall biosynthesis
MSEPLVSIIVDNYNYARFLPQSIESALAQTYARVEVIVVDDASTDGSRKVIERYAQRVMPVLLRTNGGQAASFNAGFRASRGDIVMFLDADDWLYPQAVERVVAAWQPGQSKTHFRLDLVDADGTWIDVHPAPEVAFDSGDVLPQLFDHGRYETVVTTGNAFARAALEQNMPIPEEAFRLAADGYLSIVVPFHGPVVAIEERLGAYRDHGANAYASGAPSDMAAFCARTRKRLEHDRQRDLTLRAKASAARRVPAKPPYLRDPMHIELRIASLRLDPVGHPFRDDQPLLLAFRGMVASRRASLPWSRRALLAVWFPIAAASPYFLASRAIRWKMMPANRPANIDRWLKWARRVLL